MADIYGKNVFLHLRDCNIRLATVDHITNDQETFSNFVYGDKTYADA